LDSCKECYYISLEGEYRQGNRIYVSSNEKALQEMNTQSIVCAQPNGPVMSDREAPLPAPWSDQEKPDQGLVASVPVPQICSQGHWEESVEIKEDDAELCLMMTDESEEQFMVLNDRENRNGRDGRKGPTVRDNPQLTVRRVRNSVPPFRFRYDGTGYPIYAAVSGEVPVGQSATIPTGYQFFPPKGTLLRVQGHPDVIMERRVVMEPFAFDQLYKSELSVILWNHGSSNFVFTSGALLGVITVERPLRPWIEAVDALPPAVPEVTAAPAAESMQTSLQALADTVANLSEIVRAGQHSDSGHF
jgi:dUTPase